MNESVSPGASHLECTWCGAAHPSEALMRLSPCCGKPLYARYALDGIRGTFTPEGLKGRRWDLWRYAEVLPLRNACFRPELGEGMTPIVRAERLARDLGLETLLVKDEGRNPTGSFKARGLALAVSRAAELGATAIALPSAGNAACAAAAYGASLGLPVHVVVPRDTPAPIVEAISVLGAEVRLIDGLISDCAAIVRQGCEERGWFDVSTLKEPYRVEGKKTMAYEIFEQLDGRPSMRWRGWAGSGPIARAWSPCKPRAVRPWCGRSRLDSRRRRPGKGLPPWLPVCGCRRPWGIS